MLSSTATSSSAATPSNAAMLPTPLLVLAVSALLAAACVAVAMAWAPQDRPRAPRRVDGMARSGRADALGRTDARRGDRIAIALTTGFVVLLASRWIALGAAAAGLVWAWPLIARDRRADDERRRVEGIAKWLEDLRDLLRASAMGAEEALETVAHRAPEPIREALTVFVVRRRQGFRTEDALVDLADALAHPTADAAIAAIRLVVSGQAGAGRLHPTVQALAAAARDEVSARERVDRTRSVYQSSMRRLIVIAIAMIAYLRIAADELLAAYDTPAGQLFLFVPLALWGGCVWWLRSLCAYEPPKRYRIMGVDHAVDPAGVSS